MGRLIVFTGAGLSAGSGLSTYRDSGGLWENHAVDVVANYRTWARKREEVHAFYNARRRQYAAAQPNAAHHLLASWQQRFGAILITQNVDDLLTRAGCTNVLHVHGSILDMRCVACGTTWTHGTADWDPEVDRCACNSRRGVKPGVVFFHEPAPLYRPMSDLFASLGAEDCLVVIGTTGEVIDIGTVASHAPGPTVLANRDPSTGISMPGDYRIEDRQFDHVVHGPVEQRVEHLDRLVCGLIGAETIDPV